MMRSRFLFRVAAAALTAVWGLSFIYTDVPAAGHEASLTPLERGLYQEEVSFLTDIMYHSSGEVSTTLRYEIPSELAVTGTYDEVHHMAMKTGSAVLGYIRMRHPELILWSSGAGTYGYDSELSDGVYRASHIIIAFTPSVAFRGSDDGTVDTAHFDRLRLSIVRADMVVKRYADFHDRQRIRAYADYISDAVTYDRTAARTRGYSSRDYLPWTFVNVFDGDPSTNVVCEGYAKAFEYLMDHSVFTDSTIRSRIVESTTHAWNVVTIGGRDYIVDLTRYDDDRLGERNDDFLLGSEKTLDRVSNGTYRYRDSKGTLWQYPASRDYGRVSKSVKGRLKKRKKNK